MTTFSKPVFDTVVDDTSDEFVHLCTQATTPPSMAGRILSQHLPVSVFARALGAQASKLIGGLITNRVLQSSSYNSDNNN